MALIFQQFYDEETKRNEICEATICSKEEGEEDDDRQAFESFCFARSMTFLARNTTTPQETVVPDVIRSATSPSEVDLEAAYFLGLDLPRTKQLILAITLDNINIHPVYCIGAPRFDSSTPSNVTDVFSPGSEMLGDYGVAYSREGWPKISSVAQMKGVNSQGLSDYGRAATVDFDNVGIRLMLSIDAVIAETIDAVPGHHADEASGASVFEIQQGQKKRDTDGVPAEAQNRWTRVEFDAKLKRFEVSLLRNATWLMMSAVLSGLETNAALWKYNGKEEQEEEQEEALFASRPNESQSAKENAKELSTAPTTAVDFISLDIRQIAVWYASYFDKVTGAVRRDKDSQTNLPSVEELRDLYPRPLSIGLSWASHSVTSPLTASSQEATTSHMKRNIPPIKLDRLPSWSIPREEQQDLIADALSMLFSESWHHQKSGLAFPSRPPFSHHIANAQTGLLPVVYSNYRAALSASNGTQQSTPRPYAASIPKSAADETSHSNQFSVSYSQRACGKATHSFATLSHSQLGFDNQYVHDLCRVLCVIFLFFPLVLLFVIVFVSWNHSLFSRGGLALWLSPHCSNVCRRRSPHGEWSVL